MCRREKAVPVKALLPRIKRLGHTKAFIEKGVLFVQIEIPGRAEPTEASIGLSTAAHVQEECADLAEFYPKGCPDPEAVKRCNARYEVHWELEHSVELIALHVIVQQELEKRVGAIGFNCAIVEWL